MASESAFETFSNRRRSNEIDSATLWGIVCAFGLVLFAIALGGGFFTFFDLQSALIVIGGTVGATLVHYPLPDLARALGSLSTAFYPDRHSATHRLHRIIELANRYRSLGALSLQDEAFREHDPFLKKCIELIVDGMPVNDAREMMETELTFISDRHRRAAQIFQSMGSIAPAMGLIGTLIGLVQMLQRLEDPKSIGPAMAVALLTTFYGALLAYLVFIPVSGKLRARSEEEALVKEMAIAGMVAMMKGQNPRLIEQHLHCFLPPELRASHFD
jgi:chemotaxis protein MotA